MQNLIKETTVNTLCLFVHVHINFPYEKTDTFNVIPSIEWNIGDRPNHGY